MFANFKTPQDFFTTASSVYEKFPKTPEDLHAVMGKVQKVFQTEYNNHQEMVKTYQKAATGAASINEITSANKKAVELSKAATFAGIVCAPGGIFALPLIVSQAKEMNIDIVPKSVAAQFDI